MNQFEERKNYLIDKFKTSNILTHLSIAYQAKLILGLATSPQFSILEIGPSDGSLGHLLRVFCELPYRSVDINSDLYKPDYIGDFFQLNNLPTSDLVCAFQVVEHQPFSKFDTWIQKMSCLSNKYVLFSVPDCRPRLDITSRLSILQRRKTLTFTHGPYDFRGGPCREFRQTNGGLDDFSPHYWELGQGVNVRDILSVLKSHHLGLIDVTYTPFNPYHCFFLCSK